MLIRKNLYDKVVAERDELKQSAEKETDIAKAAIADTEYYKSKAKRLENELQRIKNTYLNNENPYLNNASPNNWNGYDDRWDNPRQQAQEKPQFTKAEIKRLIMFCHPDKHKGNTEASNLTRKLLEMRKK